MRSLDQVIHHISRSDTNNLESTYEFLPQCTPLFITSPMGQFMHRQSFPSHISDFLSLWQMSEPDCTSLLMKSLQKQPKTLFKIKDPSLKYLAIVDKKADGLIFGLICSCNEADYTDLEEYYRNLSSFKDYLESFSNLIFCHLAKKSIISCFSFGLTGIGFLIGLSEKKACHNDLVCKTDLLFEKILSFADKSLGTSARSYFSAQADGVVSVNDVLFKLLVCCEILCLRRSRTSSLNLKSNIVNGKVHLCFETLFCASHSKDIYEDAIEKALSAGGIDFEITRCDSVYKIDVYLESANDKESLLSDVEKTNEFFDGLFEDDGLLALTHIMSHN